MKSMKDMAPEERKTFGQTSNLVKQELSKAVEDKKEALENQAILDKIRPRVFASFINNCSRIRRFVFGNGISNC